MDITDINPWRPDSEEYLPFQRAGIIEMSLRPQVLLADEMGLGKTIQVIGWLNVTKPGNVLIVCPNNLRLNWLSEIDKWMNPSLRETYDIEQCTTGLFIPTNFVVASYEGLTKWVKVLKDHQWDVLIMDEGHYIKNRSAQRTRAAFELKDVIPKKIILTGTPICNYPYELFPLINFLDSRQWPSAAAFEGRYSRRGRYGAYGYNLAELQGLLRNGTTFSSIKKIVRKRASKVVGHHETSYECEDCGYIAEYETSANEHVTETGHEIKIKRFSNDRIVPIEEEEVEERVTEKGVGLMIRRLKKEVLTELPRKRRQIIELPAEGRLLELVNKEKELYNERAGLINDLEEALGLRDEMAETDKSYEAIIESLRFTRGYLFNEIAIIRHELAKAKVPYVCEHLENVLENKDKVVCFTYHNDVGEMILSHFKEKAVLVYGPMNMDERHENVQKFWKDDKCELFIGSLKVAGLGINLQVAANVVFAELDWVPGVITQAEDRCHRIGQEHSLLVQHLVAQDSMDSYMSKKIVAKQKTIQKALNRQEVEVEK